MRKGLLWIGLCEVLLMLGVSGCSRGTNWQQTYEGCKTLASAMRQDSSGLLKAPDCERIQQLCSSDASGIECKNELGKYSTK
jgi:hypothetical protein